MSAALLSAGRRTVDRLLMNPECPGWLYPVSMGATTIWERWNSVLPDGHINRTHMNSMNHYSYGSIVEWMYRNMAGIHPEEEHPGFTHFVLQPEVNRRVCEADAFYDSATGLIRSHWKIRKDGKVEYLCRVPFNCKAALRLPFAQVQTVQILEAPAGGPDFDQNGLYACAELSAGTYRLIYEPTVRLHQAKYGAASSVRELMDNPDARRILEENTMLGAALSEPGFDLSQTLEKACRKDFIGMPICRDFEGLLDLLAEIR